MKIKLSEPWCGWSGLHLEEDYEQEYHCQLSYIDEILSIFGDNFNRFVMGDNVVLRFDEEGSEAYIVLCDCDYIKCLASRNSFTATELRIWSDDFVREVCRQILDRKEEWARFNAIDDDPEDIEEYRNYIDTHIKPVYELLLERQVVEEKFDE